MSRYAFSLALTAILANLCVVQGIRLPRRDLRKGNGGKSSSSSTSSTSAATAPTCPGDSSSSSTSKSGKSGRNGGRGRGKSSSTSSTSDVCPDDDDATTIACGGTITTAVALTSNLYCRTPGTTALSLTGPDASLDCQGNGIFRVPPDPTDTAPNTFGVILSGGATLSNCRVSGFERGALMDVGDNTIEDSVFIGNFFGIRIQESGCDTISNVTASHNLQDGIRITNGASGTKIVTGVTANGNVRDGFNLDGANGLVKELEDLTALGNGRRGIGITGDGPSTTNFYADIVTSNNDNDGLRINEQGGSFINFQSGSTLDASNNGAMGIDNDDGTLVFPDDSTATVCNNGAGNDITVNGGGAIVDGTLGQGITCGTDNVPTLTCATGCPVANPPNACML